VSVQLATRADGRHAETTALVRALSGLSVQRPDDGGPLGEALLLGIGGGLGGGYWLFEFTGMPQVLVIGMRHAWLQTHLFAYGICERLGLPFRVHETGSTKVAAKQLDEALAAGRRPLAWVDMAGLPYTGVGTEWERCWIHVVGVRGLNPASGDILLDDRAPTPWPISSEQLAAARKAIRYNKQRLLVVDPPEAPLSPERLREAVLAGIQACITGLVEPPIKNCELPAYRKWADLVANRRQKKGWPTAFAEPADLFRALCTVHHAIETNGTGGGGFRTLYAEFLDEAATILDRPGLLEAAEAYRALGRGWSELAAAALPDAVPMLAEARMLACDRDDLFREDGPASLDRQLALVGRLRALQESAANGLGMTSAEVDDLLLDLHGRLLALCTNEERAADLLRRAIA
jgi:hypothetical protein